MYCGRSLFSIHLCLCLCLTPPPPLSLSLSLSLFLRLSLNSFPSHLGQHRSSFLQCDIHFKIPTLGALPLLPRPVPQCPPMRLLVLRIHLLAHEGDLLGATRWLTWYTYRLFKIIRYVEATTSLLNRGLASTLIGFLIDCLEVLLAYLSRRPRQTTRKRFVGHIQVWCSLHARPSRLTHVCT